MDTSLRATRRHRSWPDALKREIVAAALVPGASVSVVARRYDVNTNLVFAWRKRFGQAANTPVTPQLMPLVVIPDQSASAQPAQLGDVIEIELPQGTRLRIGSGVKAACLRLVLDALDRR